MDNKDVQGLLDYLGLSPNSKEADSFLEQFEESRPQSQNTSNASVEEKQRDIIIQRLMNITLHCLGSIRQLVVEKEKKRVSDDITDIDGSQRCQGNASMVQRQIFAQAVNTFVDTILIGKELNPQDPVKDLVESYPWMHNVGLPSWHMLNWTIMESFLLPPSQNLLTNYQRKDSGRQDGGYDEEEGKTSLVEEYQQSPLKAAPGSASSTGKAGGLDSTKLVKNILKYYPTSITEIDRHGQHYMAYVIRSNDINILEELLYYHPQSVTLRDGRGKLPIHYAAQYSQSTETLLMICDAMKRSMNEVMMSCVDQFGNLPIHFACNGLSSMEVLKEILFCYPDGIKMQNQDGQWPLHVVASSDSYDKVKSILMMYPNVISIPDKQGWLPIQHAAYNSKSVEVLRCLYDAYPDAIKRPNSSGRIPLHYNAVRCLSSKTMAYLLEIYPTGAKVMDANKRLPIHNLIARCDSWNPTRLRCLRLLLDAFPESANMSDKDSKTILDLAERNHHGALIIRLILQADPAQDPILLGELSYRASKAKFRDEYDD